MCGTIALETPMFFTTLDRQSGSEYDRTLSSLVRKGVVDPEIEGVLSGRENVQVLVSQERDGLFIR